MAAEEIASGYLSIGPALVKDFKGKLDAQLQPVAAQVGQNLGKRTAEAMPAGLAAATPQIARAGATAGEQIASGVQTTVGPRLKKVLEDAATQGRVSFATKLRGVGASLLDEFNATGSISNTVRTTAAAAGGGSKALSTFRQGLMETASASGVLRGGLAGVTGILGGPWGIALAGAGLLLNGFITAQANAEQAAQDFADTLDKQSGAGTLKTYQEAAQRFVKEFSLADLKNTPLTLEEITRAIVTGGAELDRVNAKIQAAKDSETKAAGLNFVAANQVAEKYTRLSNAVTNLSNDNRNAATVWAASSAAMQAAQAAAGGTEAAVRRVSVATTEMATAIDSVPGGVTVEVTTNLAFVISQAREAIAALTSLQGAAAGAQYSAGAAINSYLAGLGNGSIADPIQAREDRLAKYRENKRRQAEEAARAAEQARAKRESAAAAARAKAEAAAAKKAADEAARQAAIDQKRASLQNTLTGVVAQARQTAIPNITTLPKTAPAIKRALQKQLYVLKRFRVHLQILAKRGLPQTFLQQLVEAGLDGAETAAALARAKDSDFNDIKRLTGQLNTQAEGLGNQSVKILYGTGVNAAKALIDGMDSQQRAIEAQMLKIAKGMKSSIEKALGIKSPSRVFRELGVHTGTGFRLGVEDTRPAINATVQGLVAVPRPVDLGRVRGSLAGGHGGPLIEGGLHMHNPVEKSLPRSTADALAEVGFKLGIA